MGSMRRTRHPSPSDTPGTLFRARSRRTTEGIHAFDTEARSLEQACDLIAEQQRIEKAKRTNKERKKKPMTLSQELGLAQGQAMMRSVSLPGGKTWKNPKMIRPTQAKLPHPYKDHPDKPAKVREMLESGFWGMGKPAYRRLAQLFGVSVGQIMDWAGGES